MWIVMADGKKQYDDVPREVFRHAEELTAMGLGIPQVTELNNRLRELGMQLPETVLTVQEMEGYLTSILAHKK